MLTVEVVEDDLYMRTLISEWLSGGGYQVRSHAVLGERCRPDVAAVVISLRNAPGPAQQTVARARSLYPGAALVGISAQLSQTPQNDSGRAHELGLSRLVAKPCTRSELLGAVSRAIGTGR